MSDMIDKEGKRTRDDEEKREEDPPDSVKKKSRGPSDCLNWDDDSDEEMEFVPFTQPRPVPVVEPIKKKVFAKKSVAKSSSGKVKGRSTKSSVKGKAKKSGNLFLD
jgi:hypothetical protein